MSTSSCSLGARYWRARLNKWPAFARSDPADGYTLLVPVPGDLPVFLRVALAVLTHQCAEHRVETIVVPDAVTPRVKEIVKRARRDWAGPLRFQALPFPERWALPRLNNPGRNHALQLITGTARSRSSHVVLHDADLFLMRRDILDRQYLTCTQRDLACLGVSPVWDPWFAEHQRHLAATWELCTSVEWLKSFVPALHMAHENELFGERHSFDTTLYPQAVTHPDLIGVEPSDDIVHFNYVISNYRHFQRSAGESFRDYRFLLLFIRLLVDVFDAPNTTDYRLPSLSDLGACLSGPGGKVTFPSASEGAEKYRYFRGQLERVLSGPWAEAAQRAEILHRLEPFDAFYL